MPTFSNYPYGCREVRVKNGSAASVANRAAQTLKFKESITSANLMGNDRVVTWSSSSRPAVWSWISTRR